MYLYECKTSSSPAGRLANVSVDPQMSGYCHAVQHLIRQGMIPGVAAYAVVRGYIYDVISSGSHAYPKTLKAVPVKALHPDTGEPYKNGRSWVYELDANGDQVERSPGLSMASNAGVSSWRYREAIHANGFDEADYADHLLDLMATVDPKLYVRDIATSGPEVSARYARELYAVAQQLSGYRKRSSEMKTAEDRDYQFPRQPVCIAGYGCAFRAPCLRDGDMVRSEYDAAESIQWNDRAESPQEETFKW